MIMYKEFSDGPDGVKTSTSSSISARNCDIDPYGLMSDVGPSWLSSRPKS